MSFLFNDSRSCNYFWTVRLFKEILSDSYSFWSSLVPTHTAIRVSHTYKKLLKPVPITSMYVCICINLRPDLGLNLRSNQRNYSYFISKQKLERIVSKTALSLSFFTRSSRVPLPFFSLSFLTFHIFVAVIHQLSCTELSSLVIWHIVITHHADSPYVCPTRPSLLIHPTSTGLPFVF